MSSLGATRFTTLASYASSTPGDGQEPRAINVPGAFPDTATRPTTTIETTDLPLYAANGSPPPSANKMNKYTPSTPSRNIHNPANVHNPANNPPATPINTPGSTPNPIRPRTATQRFALLPQLESGDAHSSSSTSSSVRDYDIETGTGHQAVQENDEEELGWKDAYEVMIKLPLRGLAAWMARTGMAVTGKRRNRNQNEADGDGVV
ncbi:hypothetical protein B0T20DRAFT_90460 [Sordaria brevicollis]|uniref:Uncharacterized protein n=1 Tax=Sordaria brevicollis TaxID=83679 RepID=A0AAE0NWZ2_SORBR|nr:hypothetical protein B0T20DRAFT_90460 [Sordaria brevicollis]